MDSFISAYAQLIQASNDRSVDEGDFYNSPLQHLGVEKEVGFISNNIMYPKGNPLTLEAVANAKLQTPYAVEYINFRPYENTIIFNEILLRAIPDTNTSLNPDFFNDVNGYFQDGSETVTHDTREGIYGIILEASLARICLEYQNRGLELPTQSKLNAEIKCLNNDEQHSQLCQVWHSFYQGISETGVLKKHLNGLAEKLRTGAQETQAISFRKNKLSSTAEIEQAVTSLHGSKMIKLQYTQPPWNVLLHQYKGGKQMDFSQPGTHFTFYEKHPKKPYIWTSLLLQELDSYLRENTENNHWITPITPPGSRNTEPTVMKTPDKDTENNAALQNYIEPLTCSADAAEPVLSQQLYQDGISSQKPQSHRLYNAAMDTEAITKKNYSPVELGSELRIQHKNNQSWYMTIDIAENRLNAITGNSGAIIAIHAYYYHRQLRTTLPCKLIDEQDNTINGQDYVQFTVELNELALAALQLVPNEVTCLAGIQGASCEADIVVVFIED